VATTEFTPHEEPVGNIGKERLLTRYQTRRTKKAIAAALALYVPPLGPLPLSQSASCMWLEELGPDLFIDLGFVGISFFFPGFGF
jgi:hypothetical protein